MALLLRRFGHCAGVGWGDAFVLHRESCELFLRSACHIARQGGRPSVHCALPQSGPCEVDSESDMVQKI